MTLYISKPLELLYTLQFLLWHLPPDTSKASGIYHGEIEEWSSPCKMNSFQSSLTSEHRPQYLPGCLSQKLENLGQLHRYVPSAFTQSLTLWMVLNLEFKTLIAVFNFLIGSSNLCFVSEVQWNNGACQGLRVWLTCGPASYHLPASQNRFSASYCLSLSNQSLTQLSPPCHCPAADAPCCPGLWPYGIGGR